MKKVKTLAILSALKETALSFADLCMVMATMPYRSSLNRLTNELERTRNARLRISHYPVLSEKERRTLSSILSRLEAQGLIASLRQGKMRHIHITSRGAQHKELLHKRHAKDLNRTQYPIKKGKEVILVMFDIPESQKYKRVWLRDVLRLLEFRMLQKSVWIGNTEIPKIFLENLEQYRMLPHVEILAITKSGTLKDLLKNNTENP